MILVISERLDILKVLETRYIEFTSQIESISLGVPSVHAELVQGLHSARGVIAPQVSGNRKI